MYVYNGVGVWIESMAVSNKAFACMYSVNEIVELLGQLSNYLGYFS